MPLKYPKILQARWVRVSLTSSPLSSRNTHKEGREKGTQEIARRSPTKTMRRGVPAQIHHTKQQIMSREFVGNFPDCSPNLNFCPGPQVACEL